MVKFAGSPNIQTIIQQYNTQKKLSKGDNEFINPNAAFIEHLSLAHIASVLQADAEPSQKSRYFLNYILKTTSLFIEPDEKPKPNPEYQARMESLRRRLEQKEYDTMVANVKTVSKSSIFTDDDFSSADAKMLKNQLSAIINILLSMVSVFAAIFIWKRNSPDHLRVLWGLFFAAVVGVSETGLYLLHWWNLKQHNSPKAVRAREQRNSIRQGTLLQKKCK